MRPCAHSQAGQFVQFARRTSAAHRRKLQPLRVIPGGPTQHRNSAQVVVPVLIVRLPRGAPERSALTHVL